MAYLRGRAGCAGAPPAAVSAREPARYGCTLQQPLWDTGSSCPGYPVGFDTRSLPSTPVASSAPKLALGRPAEVAFGWSLVPEGSMAVGLSRGMALVDVAAPTPLAPVRTPQMGVRGSPEWRGKFEQMESDIHEVEHQGIAKVNGTTFKHCLHASSPSLPGRRNSHNSAQIPLAPGLATTWS